MHHMKGKERQTVVLELADFSVDSNNVLYKKYMYSQTDRQTDNLLVFSVDCNNVLYKKYMYCQTDKQTDRQTDRQLADF